MRFFMIAAAMSVAALGFTGCAMNGGGCLNGGCGSEMVNAGSCGDAGCSDCQSDAEPTECGCGGTGCDSCSKYGDMSGMYGEVPSGGYGGGVQNTGMAMTVFDRGSKCEDGCGKFGCGRLGLCMPCRARGRLFAGCRDGSCGEEIVEEVVEEAPSNGLLGKLKDANAIALAEQEAKFAAGGGGLRGRAVGCGAPGCGAGGCAACLGGIARHALGHPYGGAVPHTTPPPTGGPGAGAGMAPTYAYPYYTTRGPRDFLAREPMSIGY